jgi:hypothetical protein
VAFAPAQPPDAMHEVASVEDQVSVTDEPETTDAAFAVNVTVGADAELLLLLPLLPPPPHAASSTVTTNPSNDRIAM